MCTVSTSKTSITQAVDNKTTQEYQLLGLQHPSQWTDTSETDAATSALIRSLKYAGVKFIRYATLDPSNNLRVHAVPLAKIAKSGNKLDAIGVGTVGIAGLPKYADHLVLGSNIDGRGMLTMKPDLSSLRILPYAKDHAMVMVHALDQRRGGLSPLCSRGVLSRVQEAAEQDFGVAFSVGAELEFQLFRDGKPVDTTLYGSTATLNEQQDFIRDLYDNLATQEIEVDLVHTESASGQLEIVLSYQENVMMIADNIVLARETISTVASAHGMRAVFLPKTSEEEAGNGCHLHFSFRDLKSNTPKANALCHKEKRGEISPTGQSFMEGILHHLPALLSFTIPSTNSFRRVGKGCWTGHSVGWALEDKDAAMRVCLDLVSGEATHVELKLSDHQGNIYLELATVLAAGLDGIGRDLTIRPMLVDGGEEMERLPPTFAKSLECLKKDDFLKGVLGPELSTAYIAVREDEAKHSAEMSLEEEVAKALQQA